MRKMRADEMWKARYDSVMVLRVASNNAVKQTQLCRFYASTDKMAGTFFQEWCLRTHNEYMM